MAKKSLKTCERCGMQFYADERTIQTSTCPECPIIIRRGHNKGGSTPNRSRGHAVYDIALELVTLRLAFEMIEPLLKMGRHKEAWQVYKDTELALELLAEVEAPGRETGFITMSEDDYNNG